MNDKLRSVINAMLAMQRHPWEQGVCAQALYELGCDALWLPMAYDAVKRMNKDGRLAMVGGGATVCDPASNGEVCLRAYQKTGDRFFMDGAGKMLEYLMEKAPRTSDGLICHSTRSFFEGYTTGQVWADGVYMMPPFLAVMGELDEALTQIRGYRKHLYDAENKLFYHIKDVDGDRFVRKLHWATGNGWVLMGLAGVIAAAKEKGRTEIAEELTGYLVEVLDGMRRFATADGRFKDILDSEDSFIDGTSAMMMAATVYRGIKEGFLDVKYREYADKAFRAVTGKVDRYGIIREVCGCPDFVAEGTSAEAQAAYIMAYAWKK
ncbi:MAG: glycoside hydrolase family 88 protein [Lachnospiraceae bacterium]|nr:glycoside hydrolase family 88 protein [Lachnospiraceae bacterium]